MDEIPQGTVWGEEDMFSSKGTAVLLDRCLEPGCLIQVAESSRDQSCLKHSFTWSVKWPGSVQPGIFVTASVLSRT